VKIADKFSASCIQTIVIGKKPGTYEFMAHNDVSEDCLYLNIRTAAKNAAEKRPVFVYIYGGAFTEGSTAVPVCDGEGLAKAGTRRIPRCRGRTLRFMARSALPRCRLR
jgi:para-nitrobenzyl esterase